MGYSIEREVEFTEELRELLKKYDIGKMSGTPDHYLAQYVVDILRIFNATVGHRQTAQGETLELPSLAELMKTPAPVKHESDFVMGGWTPDRASRF